MDRGNTAFEQGMQSLSVLREQSDTSAKPGESSINREDLWRASSSSWHKGAGQRYRDKEGSDPDRFWSSKGVDVWTRDELSLLHDTDDLRSISSNGVILTAGDFLYVADGTSIVRYNGSTFTNTTISTGGNAITSMATDGFHLWALTSAGAFTSDTGTSTWTAWALSGTYDKVAYARGRLLVTKNQNIFEVQGNTATSLNGNEGNTALRWSAIAEGNSAIYAANFTGNRSQIYRIAPPTDDAAGDLGVPIPAAPALPTGEVVRALYGYLGQLVIGTDKGFRVAEEDGNGNLQIGPLIKTPAPVVAFDGEGSFVWFGWSQFDDVSSGLGRIDLSQLVDNGTYAYASDLMAGSGTVTSVATYNGKRYFAIAGNKVYGETSTYVANGWLETGLIRYDVIDPKVAERVELRHKKLSGNVGVSLSADEDIFRSLGNSDLEGTVTPTIPFKAQDITGSNFNLRIDLNRGVTGTPVLQTVELRSAVVPARGMTFLVPVILAEDDSAFSTRHPSEDYEALVALVRYRRSVPYVELGKSYNVIVQDFQFVRNNRTANDKWWNGTMILKLMAPAA